MSTKKNILKESDSPVVSASDYLYAIRFLQKISTPFNRTSAYRKGIIDKDGNILKKRDDMSSADKASFTYFDLIITNLKKMLSKYSPLMRKKITPNLVAAMAFLLKENYDMEDSRLLESVMWAWMHNTKTLKQLNESSCHKIVGSMKLMEGGNFGKKGFVFGLKVSPIKLEEQLRDLQDDTILEAEEELEEDAVMGVGDGLGTDGNSPDGSALAGHDTVMGKPTRKKKRKNKSK